MQEIIVGRQGNQPFAIDNKYLWVHREHAKIVVDNYGFWFIEDLKGGVGNGVYVRNEQGIFEKVVKQSIRPDSVIRLGKEGKQSFTFMAQKVLSKEESSGYEVEFIAVKRLYAELEEEEAKLESKIRRNQMIKSVVPSIGMLFLMLPLTKIGNPFWVRGPVAIIAIIALWLFRKDPEKMKLFRQKKENLLVCPKCGRPMSKYDIKMCQCSYCKAK